MTEQTILTEPAQASAPAKPKQPRQLVRFTFYKLDPQWQLLPVEQCMQGRQPLLYIYEEHGQHSLLRSFGL